ncbi:putative F-box/FBD/LRR-repeat protein At3g23955 [Arabidopsis lyrata subsp. lyrata]|uniref:putative F-box/FBD/LRR-repeat protein At3g23955 n=1 Tax=Arabidopsis lyrata subsp. lyrata TaxID=81972 RepID=UPI000A29E14D|nr:putative F-box/FBD/LRR-repeat protein At3g23955 [Arabidopsis lyrata subsp. lyrata]|eukprot:XP_020872310.1 putative F-box/FBD/LRR-repeat protein At3g23955 [Arabidopsis lyrata subsp. lyrata]
MHQLLPYHLIVFSPLLFPQLQRDYHNQELHSEEMNQIKCLQSSLEFVNFKFTFSGHVVEMKLVSCFLENCAILKKLTLHLDSNSTEDEILTKILEIPRASTKCEVVIVIK